MLRALVLGKKISDLRKQLQELNDKDARFAEREKSLTADFNSLTDESTEEERTAVEEAMNAYDKEKREHDDKKKDLEREISDTEKELNELEDKQKTEPEGATTPATEDDNRSKRGAFIMPYRTRSINNMTMEQRNAFAESEDVKAFADGVRSLYGRKETRGITGADLTIPTTVLSILHDEVYGASKLMKYVNVQRVNGKARRNILGEVPEGIWVEMYSSLNELALVFTDKEVDGYKVEGFIPVYNEILQDSDINITDEVVSALAQGLAKAIDKAIVYGSAAAKQPTGFAATAIKANIGGKTDTALYKGMIEATGDMKHENGDTFWVMNRKTRMKLIAASMAINAAGAIVAGVSNQLPVIGGDIVEVDFVPNDEIAGGYGMDYMLAERQGATLAVSDQVKFLDDQTVFRGVARYDGKPVFNDGFICIGLGSTDPTAKIDAAHGFASVG